MSAFVGIVTPVRPRQPSRGSPLSFRYVSQVKEVKSDEKGEQFSRFYAWVMEKAEAGVAK